MNDYNGASSANMAYKQLPPNSGFAKAKYQSGVALFMFFLLMTAAGAGYYVVNNQTLPVELQKQADTLTNLNIAKAALITHAVANQDRPGGFPCPDTDGDGSADEDNTEVSFCQETRGWLPWRDLNLADIRDEAGERFWYAVDPRFTTRSTLGPLNSETLLTLTVDGVPRVAVVIAPLEALPGQGRRRAHLDGVARSSENDIRQYLELTNRNRNLLTYIDEDPNTGARYRDAAVSIDLRDVMPHVEHRVARLVQQQLVAHRTCNGSLPTAAGAFNPISVNADLSADAASLTATGAPAGHLPYETINSGCAPNTFPGWFAANRWHRLFFYAVNTNAINVNGLNNNPYDAVVVSAGAALADDNRADTNPTNYFEGENINTPPNNVYQYRSPTRTDDTYNDITQAL